MDYSIIARIKGLLGVLGVCRERREGVSKHAAGVA